MKLSFGSDEMHFKATLICISMFHEEKENTSEKRDWKNRSCRNTHEIECTENIGINFIILTDEVKIADEIVEKRHDSSIKSLHSCMSSILFIIRFYCRLLSALIELFSLWYTLKSFSVNSTFDATRVPSNTFQKLWRIVWNIWFEIFASIPIIVLNSFMRIKLKKTMKTDTDQLPSTAWNVDNCKSLWQYSRFSLLDIHRILYHQTSQG